MAHPHEQGDRYPISPLSEAEWGRLTSAIAFEGYLGIVFNRPEVGALALPVSDGRDQWEVVGGVIDHAEDGDLNGYDLALLRRIGAGLLEKYRIFADDGMHMLTVAYDQEGHTRAYSPRGASFADEPSEPLRPDHYVFMGIAIEGTTFTPEATARWRAVLDIPPPSVGQVA